MIATIPPSTSRHRSAPSGDRIQHRDGVAGIAYWVDPKTDAMYPLSYRAYRVAREAEEKRPPRHRGLGRDIDLYLWQRGLASPSDTEVSLTVRRDAPIRIRRMVAEVLRSIRRGQAAGDAIRQVSRRFGLAQARARTFMTASIDFEVGPRRDACASAVSAPPSTTCVI